VACQEFGNLVLSTIDASSSVAFAMNKDKLKLALEKRKECFNELEEFRREWELQSSMKTKRI
jgi:hypothetical protein